MATDVDIIISVREGAAEGRPLPYSYPHVDSLMRQVSEAAQAAFGASLCLTGAGRLLYGGVLTHEKAVRRRPRVCVRDGLFMAPTRPPSFSRAMC